MIKRVSGFILHIILALPIAVLLGGCEKPSPISETPEIGFKTVMPNVVTEYADSLVFTISYRDGNGDLGQNNTDNNNLFMKDSRNGVTYGFRIRQLAPDGATIAIEGKLNVTLPNLAIVNGAATESATFTIWCKDRAENESNMVESSTITINAQ